MCPNEKVPLGFFWVYTPPYFLVWERCLLLNMAIFGINVKFVESISFFWDTPIKTKMTLENLHFSIGNTSSFMVDVPASHVGFFGIYIFQKFSMALVSKVSKLPTKLGGFHPGHPGIPWNSPPWAPGPDCSGGGTIVNLSFQQVLSICQGRCY